MKLYPCKAYYLLNFIDKSYLKYEKNILVLFITAQNNKQGF